MNSEGDETLMGKRGWDENDKGEDSYVFVIRMRRKKAGFSMKRKKKSRKRR